jgi:hypothetical protein
LGTFALASTLRLSALATADVFLVTSNIFGVVHGPRVSDSLPLDEGCLDGLSDRLHQIAAHQSKVLDKTTHGSDSVPRVDTSSRVVNVAEVRETLRAAVAQLLEDRPNGVTFKEIMDSEPIRSIGAVDNLEKQARAVLKELAQVVGKKYFWSIKD